MHRPPLARPHPGRPPKAPADIVVTSLGEALEAFERHARPRLAKNSFACKHTILLMLEYLLGRSFPVWQITSGIFTTAFDVLIAPSDAAETAWREERGLKIRTGRNTKEGRGQAATTLNQFATFCHRHKWLHANEKLWADVVKSKRDDFTEAPPVIKIWVHPEDWQTVLEEAGRIHPRCRLATALLLWGARRVSELTWLKWSDLNWDEKVVTVYNQKRGRRRKKPYLPMPFVAELREEVLRYLNWYTPLYGTPDPDDFVVPSKKNPQDVRGAGAHVHYKGRGKTVLPWPLDVSKQSSIVSIINDNERLLKAFGINETGTAGTHTWRRSRLRQVALKHGIHVAQALAGHSSPETTFIYTGLDDFAQQAFTALMPGEELPETWTRLKLVTPVDSEEMRQSRAGVVRRLRKVA